MYRQLSGKIILAHDPDARPVDYLDENGIFKGVAADYVALLEQRLNFKFDIVHLSPWSVIVEKVRNKEIDVLCAFTKNLTLDKMKDMRVSYTQGWIVDEYLEPDVEKNGRNQNKGIKKGTGRADSGAEGIIRKSRAFKFCYQ